MKPVTQEWTGIICVRFEVFTVVTMKNAVFWDMTPFLQEPHGYTSQKTAFFRYIPVWSTYVSQMYSLQYSINHGLNDHLLQIEICCINPTA
jgi:hypothetical protein